MTFQHRAMIVPGDTVTVWGTVTNKFEEEGMGFVELDVGMRLQYDVESCPGKATIVLPLKNGKPIPYPFVPPKKLATK